MWVAPADHPLRRYFTGITENAFTVSLGVGDPSLIGYLAEMLLRFIHFDEIYHLRDASRRRIAEVADMICEADQLPAGGRTRREVHRHIGDLTLFWTGLYPESLQRLQNKHTKDAFIDYCEQGKRSYYIASTFGDEPYHEEARVLRRLSEEFELCAYGLNQVRHEFEQPRPDLADPARRLIH